MPLQDADAGSFEGILDHSLVAARDVVRHGARADRGESVHPRGFLLQFMDDAGLDREGVVPVRAGDTHAQIGAAVAPQYLVLFDQDDFAALPTGLDGRAVS